MREVLRKAGLLSAVVSIEVSLLSGLVPTVLSSVQLRDGDVTIAGDRPISGLFVKLKLKV